MSGLEPSAVAQVWPLMGPRGATWTTSSEAATPRQHSSKAHPRSHGSGVQAQKSNIRIARVSAVRPEGTSHPGRAVRLSAGEVWLLAGGVRQAGEASAQGWHTPQPGRPDFQCLERYGALR